MGEYVFNPALVRADEVSPYGRPGDAGADYAGRYGRPGDAGADYASRYVRPGDAGADYVSPPELELRVGGVGFYGRPGN